MSVFLAVFIFMIMFIYYLLLSLEFSCDQCSKTFKKKFNLDRHKLIKHSAQQPYFQCDQCTASFNRKDNLKRHQQGHGNPPVGLYPSDGTRSSLSNSTQPGQSHRTHNLDERPSTSKHVPSAASCTTTDQRDEAYKCPDCDYTCQDWCIYVRHRGRCHQFGYGAEDRHILPVLNEEGVVEQGLEDLYRQHAHEIYIEHYQGVVHAEYNFPTTNGTITYQEIRNHLEQILRSEGQAFKINMAFGLVLRDIISNEFTFFHPFESDGVMDRPLLITNLRDIDKFMEMLKNLNILEHLTKRRPNTRKVFHSVTNVMFYVNRTEYVLGTAEDLPGHVKKKRCIITLIRDSSTGKDLYEDNKCLFRCLALQFGASQNSLEKTSKNLLRQWCEHKNLNPEQFKGVQLKDIPQVEDLFKVNINIHTLLDADTAVSVYLSQCQYTAALYCHLWGHHLSYISDFNVFAKRFQCHLCDKLFKTVQEVKRHEKTCKEGTKFIYPGGYHRVPPTVFEDLDSYGINVPKQDRLYPFFCCFDFEALLVKNEHQKGKVTTVLQTHQPVSVAIASNVCHPDCKHTEKDKQCHLCQSLREPVCFVDTNVSSLLDQLFAKAEQIQEAAEACTRKKLHAAFAKLDQKISMLEAQKVVLRDVIEEEEDTFNQYMNKLMQQNIYEDEDELTENEEVHSEDEQDGDDDGIDDYSDFQQKEIIKQLEIFKSLKFRLEEYARILPLLGFNNARYVNNQFAYLLASITTMTRMKLK